MFRWKLYWCLTAVVMLLVLPTSALALRSEAVPLELTVQERAYFNEHRSLRVLTAPDCQPYAYGEQGLAVDMLERLCTTAGLTLELIEADSYSDALAQMAEGAADLAAVNILPHGAETASDMVSVPYLRAPLQMVHHGDSAMSGQAGLTIVQLRDIDFGYDIKYSFVEATFRNTVRDCLDAVRSLQGDLFLCDSYQLSVYSDSFAARNLTMTTVPQHEITVAFGLGEGVDPRLISALERTVASFSTSELSTLLMGHANRHAPVVGLIQFVYRNPFELICAITCLFFVVLLCVFVSLRIRSGQQQELRGYEESYRMLANTFGEAGMEYDFLNDRLTLFGEHRSRIDLPEVVEQVHRALEQRTLRISLSPEELDTMLEKNEPGRSYEIELRCGMSDGAWNWFRMIYIVVCTSESHRRPIRMVGCLVNIEAEHQERERLFKIGHNDPLTGLLNRAAAEAAIVQALPTMSVPKVLLFLDIDRFKDFNDSYGHSCGDAVLSALGQTMREVFPGTAVLSRWGGDEFLIYLEGEQAQMQQLEACLRTLQEKMWAFAYQERHLPVTLSIGGGIAPSKMSFQALFELADKTLYNVKKSGRNSYQIARGDHEVLRPTEPEPPTESELLPGILTSDTEEEGE